MSWFREMPARGVCKETMVGLLGVVCERAEPVGWSAFLVWRWRVFAGVPGAGPRRGAGQGTGGLRSYTLVVECPCGMFVLFWLPLKVLNVCSGCMPVSVLGIMVMVLGVMSGMSSGERRSVSV